MNKIFIIFIVLAGMCFSSCEKYLEVDPANVKSISTIEDVRGLLGGYLLTIKDPNYNMNGSGNPYKYNWYGMSFFPTGGVARMFYYYDNSLDYIDYANKYVGERFQSLYLEGMVWNMRSVHKEIWDNSYKTIGLMNSILTELGNVGGNKNEREMIKGEVKVIRCWHAFKLLQYFAPFSDNEKGIPLNFDSEAIAGYNGARKRQSEVYRIIINELQEVLGYEAPFDENYNVFYKKSIINAILAKIFMYKAEGPAKDDTDWTTARNYAMEAMKGKSLATTGDDLNSMFKSDNVIVDFHNPHCLISFFNDMKDFTYISGHWGYPQYAYDWEEPEYAGLLINPELFATYSEGDIRLEDGVYLYDNLHKEVGKYYQDNYDVREIFPMFRIADLHLLVAESYIREGDEPNAKDWISDFRQARNAGEFTGTNVLEEILQERWREFIFEFDYRWIDMKRNGMSLTRTFIDPDKEDPVVSTLEADDYRYNFYIPESELSVNKSLKQNEGWKVSGI